MYNDRIDLPSRPFSAAALPEELAIVLEGEIIRGRLPAAMRLTEEDVANRYGISRSPVREALRLLERDGLVQRSARRGIWVSPVSVKDFDNVYSVRIPLEALAAEQAANSRNTALKAKLDEALDGMRSAAADSNVEAFFLSDVQGSEVIYQLADNPVLSRLLAGLNKQALRYRYLAYARDSAIVTRSMDESAAIFAAISSNSGKKARRLTEHLIGSIWRDLRRMVAETCKVDGER
jgi:DNA-binding GntR family transcriptional regulator